MKIKYHTEEIYYIMGFFLKKYSDSGVASSCPSVCVCTNTSNGVNVNCSSRGLYSIPTDLPNNTYDL
jgi:hypothetical protein